MGHGRGEPPSARVNDLVEPHDIKRDGMRPAVQEQADHPGILRFQIARDPVFGLNPDGFIDRPDRVEYGSGNEEIYIYIYVIYVAAEEAAPSARGSPPDGAAGSSEHATALVSARRIVATMNRFVRPASAIPEKLDSRVLIVTPKVLRTGARRFVSTSLRLASRT